METIAQVVLLGYGSRTNDCIQKIINSENVLENHLLRLPEGLYTGIASVIVNVVLMKTHPVSGVAELTGGPVSFFVAFLQQACTGGFNPVISSIAM